MFINTLLFLLLLTPPVQDSTIIAKPQISCLDSTSRAVFQTLEAAFQAVEHSKNNNRKNKYPTFSILSFKHLSIQEFQDSLECTLPLSAITDSTFRIGVSKFIDQDACLACTTLVVSFFNPANENNMPIANYRYYLTTKKQIYEYITVARTVKLIIEEKQ